MNGECLGYIIIWPKGARGMVWFWNAPRRNLFQKIVAVMVFREMTSSCGVWIYEYFNQSLNSYVVAYLRYNGVAGDFLDVLGKLMYAFEGCILSPFPYSLTHFILLILDNRENSFVLLLTLNIMVFCFILVHPWWKQLTTDQREWVKMFPFLSKLFIVGILSQ